MCKTTLLLASLALVTACSSSNQAPSADNNGDTGNTNNSGNSTEQAQNEPTPVLITADKANALVLQAFDVLTGRAYDSRLSVFPYTQIVDIPLSTASNVFVSRFAPRECDNAGQLSTITEFTDGSYRADGTYSDCLVGSDTLNGHALLLEGYDTYQFRREFNPDFKVSFEPNGEMSVSGAYQQRSNSTFNLAFSVNNFDYRFSYPGGTLTVLDASTERTFRMDGQQDDSNRIAYMSGSFSMRPPILGGTQVSVEVTDAFVNEQLATRLSYERGTMKISDGRNEIVVTADNGNASTVSITANIEGEAQSIKEQPWSVWVDALAFEPPAMATAIPLDRTTSRDNVIRSDNYQSILAEVLGVYTGQVAGPDALDLPGFAFPDSPVSPSPEFSSVGLGELTTVSCSNGGSADLRHYQWGERQITRGWNASFDSCADNGYTLDGTYHTRNFGNFSNGSKTGLTVTSQDRTETFKGTLDYKHRPNRDGGPPVHYYFSGDHTVNNINGTSYEILQASTEFAAIYTRTGMMNGRFYIKSAATENEMLKVQTADPFIYQDSNFDYLQDEINSFNRGMLIINAANGNKLIVNANNGDEDTFNITVIQPNQADFSTTESWAEWQPYVSFVFNLHERKKRI